MNHLLDTTDLPNRMDTTLVSKHSQPIQGVESSAVGERHAEVWGVKVGAVCWLRENRVFRAYDWMLQPLLAHEMYLRRWLLFSSSH